MELWDEDVEGTGTRLERGGYNKRLEQGVFREEMESGREMGCRRGDRENGSGEERED